MDDTRHSEYVVFDKTLSPIEPVRLPTSKYSRPYPTNRHDSIFASLDDVHPIDLHYSHDQHHHESLDSINAPVHGHDGLSKSSFPSDLPPRSPRRPSPSAKLWSNPKHCRNRPRLKIDPPALIPLAEPSLAQKAQAQQIWTDPQDGRAAWMHALVAFWLVFSCWGLTSIYGVFQAYYYRNPQLSDSISRASISSLAWIGSTQLGLVFLLGLPMGYLVDSGYLISAFRTSSLLFALAVWLTAQCTSWSSLWLVQGLLTGLGAGGVFGCGIAILSTWFSPARISSAMAVGACGSCVGAICFALVTKTLLLHAGFATTMRVLGAIVTTSLVPAQFVFRYRRSQYLPLHTRYRVKRGQTRFRIAIKTFTSWWTKAYTLAAAGMFLTFLGLYFGFVYIISYASEVVHLSLDASVNLLIYMMLANIPGRAIPALFSDKCMGPLNTIIPATILSSAVLWFWTCLPTFETSVAGSKGDEQRTPAILIVVACFYGFVSAGIQVLYSPTVYSICRTELPSCTCTSSSDSANVSTRTDRVECASCSATVNLGARAGGIFTIIGLACLFGTPIGGALIQHRTSRGFSSPYLGAQVFAALCLLLGGGFLFAARIASIDMSPRKI